MQAKQRLLNAITGGEVDRVPFSPFLAYYWEYLPQDVQKMGQFEYLKMLGADPLLRGFWQVSTPIYKKCEISDVTNGDKRHVCYETNVGKLELEYTFSAGGNSWFLTKHPVETVEELKVLEYIYSNITFEEKIKEFNEQYDKYGDEALCVPTIGVMSKTPFQSLVEHWCGTENITYLYYDYPEKIEECLDVMRQIDRKSCEIAVKSKAEAFIFWEDSSTTNISPNMFDEFTKPTINEWAKIIHDSDKLLIHHACGHLYDLMDNISATDIDALESVSPPPTGNIELAEARKKLRDDIAIIGGIEPTVLLNSNNDELAKYVIDALNSQRGERYVLANSDSCPPFVEEEKFKLISKLVREFK